MARHLPPIGAMVKTEGGRVGRVVEHHERMNWVWVSYDTGATILEKGKIRELYPWVKNWDALGTESPKESRMEYSVNGGMWIE